MAPLIVLVTVTLLTRLAGEFGVAALRDWRAATRVGLAVMLCFTAGAHFNSMRDAAIALIVFLIAVLPANIHAARAGLTIGGSAVTPLVPRVALQLLFILLVWWSGVRRSVRPRLRG